MEKDNKYKLSEVAIRLVDMPPLMSDIPMNSPEAAVKVLAELLKNYDREVVCVINLQSDLKPINMNIVSMGALNESVLHPREVLKSAILSNAAQIMLVHNHPSGSLVASKADIAITDRMRQVCELMGISLVDHIIVSKGNRYFSFREKEVLSMPYTKYASSLDEFSLTGKSVAEDGVVKEASAKYRHTKVDPKEQMKDIMEKLEQGVKDVFESNHYKAFLATMSKFHNYSLNNTILIAMQRPDATLVAGFNTWKNQHQRSVKKGEKGIKIIAPAPFKIEKEQDQVDVKSGKPIVDKDGEVKKETVEISMTAFKTTTVFDISQTEGKELPSLGVNELVGNVNEYHDLLEALKETCPVPITFGSIPGDHKGKRLVS